jgi:hypothetical protein
MTIDFSKITFYEVASAFIAFLSLIISFIAIIHNFKLSARTKKLEETNSELITAYGDKALLEFFDLIRELPILGIDLNNYEDFLTKSNEILSVLEKNGKEIGNSYRKKIETMGKIQTLLKSFKTLDINTTNISDLFRRLRKLYMLFTEFIGLELEGKKAYKDEKYIFKLEKELKDTVAGELYAAFVHYNKLAFDSDKSFRQY